MLNTFSFEPYFKGKFCFSVRPLEFWKVPNHPWNLFLLPWSVGNRVPPSSAIDSPPPPVPRPRLAAPPWTTTPCVTLKLPPPSQLPLLALRACATPPHRASSPDYPLEHEHHRKIVPPASGKPIYPSAHSSSTSPSYKYAQSTLTPISIAALPPLKLSSELTAGTRPPPHPYPNRATH